MSPDERRERWDTMMAVLRENDIDDWFSNFLAALAATSRQAIKVPYKRTASAYAVPSVLPNPFGIAAAKSS
jgi:trehalose-6-phosphate synthase